MSHSGSPTVGKDPGVYVVVTTTEDAKNPGLEMVLINPNQNESGALEVFINQHNGAGCRECRLVIKNYMCMELQLLISNQEKSSFSRPCYVVLKILFPVAVVCVSFSIISD